MKNKIIMGIAISSSIMLGGCASIMNSNSQTITVSSKPSGQKYQLIKEGKGVIKSGTTPDQVTLKRYNFSYYHIKIGDVKEKIEVHASAWMFGNIVFATFPGMIVDLITGDQGYYNNIFINTKNPKVIIEPFTGARVTDL